MGLIPLQGYSDLICLITKCQTVDNATLMTIDEIMLNAMIMN